MLKKFTCLVATGLLMATTAFGQYCIPDYTSDLSGDYCDDFTISGPGVFLENLGTGEPVGNYTDYTGSFDAIVLTAGSSYDVTVDCGPSWDQGIAVYVDLNFDETFSADERLGCTLVDAGTGGATYTVTIPAGSAPGETRLRVLADYADNCTVNMDNMAACTVSSSFGETEDYAVIISAGEDCSGAPDAAVATSTLESTCASDVFTVSVPGVAAGGITYQWWSSADGVDYSEIAGATSFNYSTSQTEATYYQCEITCTVSGESTISSAVFVDNVCPGCMDETSLNYNAEANTDDGSCIYPYVISDCDYASSYMSAPDFATLVCLGDDAVSAATPIGFSFPFYGTPYTDVYIGSNGYMNFSGTTLSACCSGQLLPNGSYPASIFFGQEDLDPNSCIDGDISYWTEGVAGSQIFVVDFTGVPHYPGPEGTFPVSVQVQLHEATGDIKIVTTEYNGDGGNSTMGLNLDGTIAQAVEGRNSAAWSAYDECILFSTGAPVTCSATTAPEVSVISSTVAEVSWAAVDGATQYVFVLRDNTTGEKWTRNTTETFMSLPALTAGHSYTTRIRTNCYPEGMSAPSPQTDFAMPLRMGLTEEGVSIYPNPSNGNFRIQLNGYEAGEVTVMVMNAVGQVVFNNIFQITDAIAVQDINLTELAAGTYTVRLIDGSSVITRNIVIE
jgi:hypothetical protein